jgi:hypothetical protein
MLYVYTYPTTLKCDFDLSKTSLQDLGKECKNIVEHHISQDKTVYLGYLDGWMLDPIQSVVLRQLIRKFKVYMVSVFPEHLPHAWKTDIHTVFVKNE